MGKYQVSITGPKARVIGHGEAPSAQVAAEAATRGVRYRVGLPLEGVATRIDGDGDPQDRTLCFQEGELL